MQTQNLPRETQKSPATGAMSKETGASTTPGNHRGLSNENTQKEGHKYRFPNQRLRKRKVHGDALTEGI